MKFRFYVREHLHIPMNPLSRTIANSMKDITQKECKIKQIVRILAKSSHTKKEKGSVTILTRLFFAQIR